MKHFLRLTDYTKADIYEIFHITDEILEGHYQNLLQGKSVVLFFPESSIRTRVTFEKGIALLGGQPILFPSSALDKKEDLQDVIGYLNNWANLLVVRHRDMAVLEKIAASASVPVINALTDANHPCEMAADLYALSKIRNDFTMDHFLFCGVTGNIGLAWKEASEVMGFSLEQCCIPGYEMDGVPSHHCIRDAIRGKDIICTDSLPADLLSASRDCTVDLAAMKLANSVMPEVQEAYAHYGSAWQNEKERQIPDRLAITALIKDRVFPLCKYIHSAAYPGSHRGAGCNLLKGTRRQ